MYIGIDIGGTKCAVVYGDEKGNIVSKERFDTTNVNETLDNIFSAVERCGKADAIGISCGGPLDSERGVILSPPNLPGWDEIYIVKMLEEKFGIPTAIENDANACALAEFTYGAGRGCKNMVFFTFGTGLGAGLILDGRLYRGTNGMAGEAGHIRLSDFGPVGYGKAGSFEGFCSGGGIAQLGRMKALEAFGQGKNTAFCKTMDDLRSITSKKIADCAKEGDELSKEIYRICGRKMGYGLSIIADILNPEKIVLGSIYPRAKELLEESINEVMKAETLSYSYNVCSVVGAELGESIGDYAALAVAANLIKERKNA